MLVSIITIFKNEERFLAEAVGSVRAQTLGDWEYFLVDDGSDDQSTRIARDYAARDPRIRYLEHPEHSNRGMSASRNLGLRHASGELVCFIDGDDVWIPDKLERQVGLFRRNPSLGFSYGASLYWYSWCSPPLWGLPDKAQPVGFSPGSVVEAPKLLKHFLSNSGDTPCPSSLILPLSTANRLGGFAEEFPGLYEDQAFVIKLSLAETAELSPENLTKYRQHENSACAKAFSSGAHAQARLAFLNWVKRYLAERQFHDPEVAGLLEMELTKATSPGGTG